MESRATRRGNQVTVKEKNKSDLKPRDVMRIIVKNYYRKDRMIILLKCLESLRNLLKTYKQLLLDRCVLYSISHF